MLRSTRAQLSAALFALLLVALASTAATFLGTRDHDDDHQALDAVDYLRELSNEISLLALLGSQEPTIEPQIAAFEQNLEALQSGGSAFTSDGRTVSIGAEEATDIRAAVDEVESRWSVFRESALQAGKLTSEAEGRIDAIEALQANALLLLSAIDELDHSYGQHMERDIMNLRLAQVVSLVSAAALLGWGVIAIRRRVLRLSDLPSVMERIQAQNMLGALPEEVYADEVAGLVESFDRMRPLMTHAQETLEARILRRTRDFMTAFEYSQGIVSQTDKHEILRLGLANAMSLGKAESAALCLIESDGSYLEVLSVDGRVEANVALSPARASASPYQTIPIKRDASPREICEECCFGEACAGDNVLKVPLEAANRQVGTLCVARESRREFEEHESQTLRLLASSVAIAISNYRLGNDARLRERQEAVKEERERLAAALHDNLAQTLAYLNLRADRAIKLVGGEDSGDALNELTSIKSVTRDAYDSVRGVIDNLSDVAVDEAPETADAIAKFVAEYQALSGLDVSLYLDRKSLGRLAPAVQQQAVHIIRESLTNVMRHAQATAVSVNLEGKTDGVELRIEDNGRGFDPQIEKEGTHLGLTIMHARSRRSGGSLAIRSQPDQGTTICAFLPYQSVAIHAN